MKRRSWCDTDQHDEHDDLPLTDVPADDAASIRPCSSVLEAVGPIAAWLRDSVVGPMIVIEAARGTQLTQAEAARFRAGLDRLLTLV